MQGTGLAETPYRLALLTNVPTPWFLLGAADGLKEDAPRKPVLRLHHGHGKRDDRAGQDAQSH